MEKGANIPVTAEHVRATLRWQGGPVDLDVSALLLAGDGRVRGDADFVFYNQPTHPASTLRHAGKTPGQQDVLELGLAGIEPAIERVVLAASSDGGPFGSVPGLALFLDDAATGANLAVFPVTAASETALVAGELYRRGGGWKFRAVGQGYDTGLAGLATDFGISVGEDQPVSLKKQKLIDMEKRVGAQAPALLSLTKTASVSLEKRGLGEHSAKCVLCLDISASMGSMYRQQKIQALAERVLALAMRFDDDGEVDVFLFGAQGHEAGSLNLGNYQGYTDQLLRTHRLEGGTRYGEAMTLIRQSFFGDAGPREAPVRRPLPVYVMFVTDGATSDIAATMNQIQWSSYEPVFWQFMAIGEAFSAPKGGLFRRADPNAAPTVNRKFKLLDELDHMSGRFLDNANFFAVADPVHIPDEQLYELMMAEYPSWLQQAKGAGLLP